MSDDNFNPDYLIHSDDEPLRLERQARLYGTEDDLRFLAVSSASAVLDAGCGSGSATRAIARNAPIGRVVGIDREPKYIDFARRTADSEGLTNVQFEIGDVLRMPFPDGSFDIVWSKHLLQWVAKRSEAIAELVRVTRRGGRVVCCNFDRFCLAHYPTDERLQAELESWFAEIQNEDGIGRCSGEVPCLSQPRFSVVTKQHAISLHES